MLELRALTPAGIEQFGAYLEALRAEPTAAPPFGVLYEPSTSRIVDQSIVIDPSMTFTNRLEVAQHLTSCLSPLDRALIDHDAGLWSWLGLRYFDQLCPPQSGGARKPGRAYRYILPRLEQEGHFRHYYRHLLAGPYRLFRMHGEKARLLLSSGVDVLDDFNEQIASRQELVTNPGIVHALDLLYYDTEKQKPKRGAASNKRKAGTLRRFIDVIQQLDLTYDLYSMSGPQLLGILPREFDRWRAGQHPPDGA